MSNQQTSNPSYQHLMERSKFYLKWAGLVTKLLSPKDINTSILKAIGEFEKIDFSALNHKKISHWSNGIEHVKSWCEGISIKQIPQNDIAELTKYLTQFFVEIQSMYLAAPLDTQESLRVSFSEAFEQECIDVTTLLLQIHQTIEQKYKNITQDKINHYQQILTPSKNTWLDELKRKIKQDGEILDQIIDVIDERITKNDTLDQVKFFQGVLKENSTSAYYMISENFEIFKEVMQNADLNENNWGEEFQTLRERWITLPDWFSDRDTREKKRLLIHTDKRYKILNEELATINQTFMEKISHFITTDHIQESTPIEIDSLTTGDIFLLKKKFLDVQKPLVLAAIELENIVNTCQHHQVEIEKIYDLDKKINAFIEHYNTFWLQLETAVLEWVNWLFKTEYSLPETARQINQLNEIQENLTEIKTKYEANSETFKNSITQLPLLDNKVRNTFINYINDLDSNIITSTAPEGSTTSESQKDNAPSPQNLTKDRVGFFETIDKRAKQINDESFESLKVDSGPKT